MITLVAVPALAIALAIRFTHPKHSARPATVAEIEQQVHDNPGDEQARLSLSAALFAQHRIPEAEAACQAAATIAPSDPRPLNSLALLAIGQNKQADALNYLRKSLGLKNDDADVWRAYGMMLKKQWPGDAEQAFQHATSLNKRDSASWLEMGMLQMDNRQFPRGLHSLQTAAALSPNNLETNIALGNSARTNDRPTVAAQAFDKALTISPDNLQAQFGSAAATLQLDPTPAGMKRAKSQLDHVIAAGPTAEAYLVRGHWNLMQQRYAEAISDLNLAVKLEPRLTTAHSMLYQCYSATGNQRLAHEESLKFMTTAPGYSKSKTVSAGK